MFFVRWKRVMFFRSLFFLVVGTLICFFLWQTVFNRQSSSDDRMPEQYSLDLPGCSAIITGDIEGKKADFEVLLFSKRTWQLPETFYLNITRDCQNYIENRGFITEPLSKEEKDFPIAYSMVIHEQIEMFERLLRAIYTPQNIYCVHVDQKSTENYKNAVKAIISCFPNVFMASKLERVVYASWSRVQADLNCMKDLLSSHVQWRYLLNTCGTDFPLKTNREMVKALKALKGRNSMATGVPSKHLTARWDYHYIVTDFIMGTGTRKSPPPITSPMYAGNAYIVVTRDFVRHVLQDKDVQKFVEWEKDTYSPDEHMWATLQRMANVPGSMPASNKYDESEVQAIARMVKWGGLGGDVKNGASYPECTGIYRRGVCVYGIGDISWLLKQHHLLANKFDPLVDDVAIRCLESFLRFKALNYESLTTECF
ncbi:beta-1,3-galactosyl-O-glycosyl-glycoprotein beta-1,6-N-acetylglucosaminyltransferase 3-like [Thalassophryne amazonica]|uniref:beta-1,3-galactosyl-O-glycosyl-glycoprotein beta-1,6-N-acetylglucosaminyltransferase 3-like n=1 Tax=Thalassophryne amazonica TaxID=390379 RepID=UPI001471C1B1|nr:beta-1,3-galactosyl-O-glycosyl-glycoprotein beta-1,6-N-acetylglucosaminyltransferase 3-like [Thalassophryne amazonica]